MARSQIREHHRLVIGLIGLPCAGKSEVAAILRRLGVQTIEADAIGHRILVQRPVRQALVERFGQKICGANGQIDRSALAAIVFRNGRQRRYLEQLVHPLMSRQIRQRLRAAGRPIAIVAAILFRLGWHRLCHRIWLVKASAGNRRRRAQLRGWSAQELERRSRSVRDDIRVHRHLVDEVIANDSDLRCLRRLVGKIWKGKSLCPPVEEEKRKAKLKMPRSLSPLWKNRYCRLSPKRRNRHPRLRRLISRRPKRICRPRR